MSAIIEFFKTDIFMAVLVATSIFSLTIFLVVKRWIGFSITLLMLFVALVTGVAISNQQLLNCYIDQNKKNQTKENDQLVPFQKQISQALEQIQDDVSSEKANLNNLVDQLKELVTQMEVQKEKLQNFIDETHENYKIDEQKNPPSPEKNTELPPSTN